ncbi:MAG: hypothetical protein M0P74_17925, partial [Syntrophales bacterium]|nr:hypothetical protein [Syntrophales bacterium]
PPHTRKKIFAYTKTLPTSNGLVQLQDKIVVRFALTIYPYSFGGFHKSLEVIPICPGILAIFIA